MIAPLTPALDALVPLVCMLEPDEVETAESIVRSESGRVVSELISAEVQAVLNDLHPDSRTTVERPITVIDDIHIAAVELWVSTYTMTRTKALMAWDGDPSQGLAVASGSIPYPDPETVHRHAVSLLPIRTPQA